jgi:hypothetical protein
MKQITTIYLEESPKGQLLAKPHAGVVNPLGLFREEIPVLTSPDPIDQFLYGDLVFLRRLETGEGIPISIPTPPLFKAVNPTIKQTVARIITMMQQKIQFIKRGNALQLESPGWKKTLKSWWYRTIQPQGFSRYFQEIFRLIDLADDEIIPAITGLGKSAVPIPTAHVNLVNQPGFYKDGRITDGKGNTEQYSIRVDSGAEYTIQDQEFAVRACLPKTGRVINIAGLDGPTLPCPIVKFKLAIDSWIMDAEAAIYPGLYQRVKSVMLLGENIIRPAIRAGVQLLEV